MGNAVSLYLCQNCNPNVNFDTCCCIGNKQDGDEQELIVNKDKNSMADPKSSVGDQDSTNNTIIYNTIINAESFHFQWWPPRTLPPTSQPPLPPPPPPPRLPPSSCLPLSLNPPSDSEHPESIRNISASTLRVAHSERSQYTAWHDDPGFKKVAELLKVWWFDIGATMKLKELSRSTTYAAYLIFKINVATSFGLNNSQQAILSLKNSGGDTYYYQRKLVCVNPERNSTQSRGVGMPAARSDGWMEVELGQFYCDDDADDQEEVELSFEDKNSSYPKCGLIYAGIEVRHTQTAEKEAITKLH